MRTTIPVASAAPVEGVAMPARATAGIGAAAADARDRREDIPVRAPVGSGRERGAPVREFVKKLYRSRVVGTLAIRNSMIFKRSNPGHRFCIRPANDPIHCGREGAAMLNTAVSARILRRHLVLLVLALGVPLGAKAVPLGDLVQSGDFIIANDKIFFDWIFEDLSDIAVDPATIDVTALTDDPRNPGLKFSADLQVVGAVDVIEFFYGFSVATLDGVARIKDNSLRLIDFGFGPNTQGGFVSVAEDLFDDNGNDLAFKFVFADNLFQDAFLFDAAAFAPVALAHADTEVFMFGDFDGDVVSLRMWEQRFSQIPEPGTLALTLMASCAAGAVRRASRR
jgi:hypothetical protein